MENNNKKEVSAEQKAIFEQRLMEDIERAEQDVELPELTKYNMGAWSFSKMKVLKNCPYQYYLKYVLKIKRSYLPQDSSLEANVGTTAHAILEHVACGKSIEDSYKKVNQQNEAKPILTPEQWEKHIETLQFSISSFARKLDEFNARTKIKKIHAEVRAAMTADYKATDFFNDKAYFRGIIDLCLETEQDSDLIIIDHKHGGGEFNNTVRNYEAQLDSYKPLFNYGISPINGAQSGIHFIKEGKMVWGQYKPKKEIEGRLLNELEMRLGAGVDRVNELGFFKHVMGSYCQWCDFKEECKAGKLKANEKATIRFFKKEDLK